MIILRIGFVGLGRMGLRMVSRLASRHEVLVFDINSKRIDEAESEGAIGCDSIIKLVSLLPKPRVIWMMVPAGDAVESVLNELDSILDAGDIIIDGGNSNYKDSVRRAEALTRKDVYFLDVGTSGGLEGAESGASFTVGGNKKAYEFVIPIFEALAKAGAYLYCGESGSGHYVKMVHNGIEYAMLQSLGEGFEMLKEGPYEIDLEAVSKVWNNGCVIRSWMLELASRVFSDAFELSSIKGEVGGGETGRWMIEAAMAHEVPTPVIALSLLMRYRSRQEDSFSAKVVAAIRKEFGGHEVVVKEH